ncbi:hypothetical protein [Paraliomyxa miuraensis]|uniref:hypothetical protein n=1 Tax=Paraliomyxa miuraensis TaxID=376150 RepID=UPI002256DD53|nr:hypothetical protein [Paraliomyxa miuraensis]MCX4241390.1 hypothetical protein [Paraliomyxa miuraensis]
MPTADRRPVRILAPLSVLLVSACLKAPSGSAPEGTVAPPQPAAAVPAKHEPVSSIPDPFPTQAELDQISARPHPEAARLLGQSVAPIDAWDLQRPVAQRTEVVTYRGDDPNARALAAVLAEGKDGRRVTQGMQCVAEEMSRFVLAHGDEPAADLRGFIVARCGTPVSFPAVAIQRLPVEELPGRPLHPVKDRQFLDALAKDVPAEASAGFFIGRGEDEAVLGLAFGVPDVELEPVPLVLDGRHEVDVRGRMRWDFDNLSGHASRGELGALPCRPITHEPIAAPRFALRCPVAIDDAFTVIELNASPKGRLLGRGVLRLLVSSRGPVPTHYQSPRLSLPIGPQEHDDLALATAVSALRRKAGMEPVIASAGQSEVLAQLLPHFLVAIADPSQGELADQIALGMMAGRKVGTAIRWGSFSTSTSPSNWPLERDLAAELFSPYSRSRLFDPEANTVAYTEISDPAQPMRVSVIASYSELRDRDYTPQIVALFETIDRQRAAAGLDPLVRVMAPGDVRTMAAVAARVRDGELMPEDAVGQLLRHFAEQTHRSFEGMVLLPHSLEGWNPALEGPIVTDPQVAAAITISHFRPPGAAWGRNLVIVVFTVL